MDVWLPPSEARQNANQTQLQTPGCPNALYEEIVLVELGANMLHSIFLLWTGYRSVLSKCDT